MLANSTTTTPQPAIRRVSLSESATPTYQSGPLRVDATNGIADDVKVLGLTSKNRRRYLESTLTEALPMYEGTQVFIDHPIDRTGTSTAQERPFRELFGWLESVRVDDGYRARLRFNPDHAHAKDFAFWAKNNPGKIGFSHNAEGDGYDEADGTLVVTRIDKVHSVDIVTLPATTKGLFESMQIQEKKDASGHEHGNDGKFTSGSGGGKASKKNAASKSPDKSPAKSSGPQKIAAHDYKSHGPLKHTGKRVKGKDAVKHLAAHGIKAKSDWFGADASEGIVNSKHSVDHVVGQLKQGGYDHTHSFETQDGERREILTHPKTGHKISVIRNGLDGSKISISDERSQATRESEARRIVSDFLKNPRNLTENYSMDPTAMLMGDQPAPTPEQEQPDTAATPPEEDPIEMVMKATTVLLKSPDQKNRDLATALLGFLQDQAKPSAESTSAIPDVQTPTADPAVEPDMNLTEETPAEDDDLSGLSMDDDSSDDSSDDDTPPKKDKYEEAVKALKGSRDANIRVLLEQLDSYKARDLATTKRNRAHQLCESARLPKEAITDVFLMQLIESRDERHMQALIEDRRNIFARPIASAPTSNGRTPPKEPTIEDFEKDVLRPEEYAY